MVIFLNTVEDHLLSDKSASLQYEEQNKTRFGSKEITRQQIFKGIHILGDSDVLTGSGIIIFSSSVLPHSLCERRQMGKTLLARLVSAERKKRKKRFGLGNTDCLHMKVKGRLCCIVLKVEFYFIPVPPSKRRLQHLHCLVAGE